MTDPDEAWRGEPTDAAGFIRRADDLSDDDRFAEAVADYTEALRLEPDNAEALLGRAFARYDDRDLDGAAADYQAALRIDPWCEVASFRREIAETYARRGMGLYYGKRYDHQDEDLAAALEAIEESIRWEPEWGLTHDWRGILRKRRGDYRRAIDDFTEAARLEPEEANHIYHRGLTWVELGDHDRAIADFGEAMRLDPADHDACRERGDLWCARRRYDLAVDDYTEAIRRRPGNYDSYEARAVAWTALKAYDRALDDFAEVVRRRGHSSNTICRRGDARRGGRDFDGALADYDLAIAEYSKEPGAAVIDWAEPYLGKAVVRLFLGRAEAIADARDAIEAEGWRGGLATRAALVGHFAARRVGRDDEARRFLDDAAADADAAAWPFPVVRFLRREIAWSELLALAVGDEALAEARCWVAYDHLMGGRVESAREGFRLAAEAGAPLAFETFLAEAELGRLRPASGPSAA